MCHLHDTNICHDCNFTRFDVSSSHAQHNSKGLIHCLCETKHSRGTQPFCLQEAQHPPKGIQPLYLQEAQRSKGSEVRYHLLVVILILSSFYLIFILITGCFKMLFRSIKILLIFYKSCTIVYETVYCNMVIFPCHQNSHCCK